MSRIAFSILSSVERQKAAQAVSKAPLGAFFDLRENTRSIDQNNLLWQRLTELSNQLDWGGQKLTPDDWKDVMTAGLRRARIVPNIDGDGFVQIGLHTSGLTTAEMTDLLDLMSAFAANHGVTFKDEQAKDSEGEQQVAATNDEPLTMDSPGTAPGESPYPPSTLSDNWRQEYLQCLAGVRDKAASGLTRHTQALQIIGGDPTPRELAWMRLAFALVKRRNGGGLPHAEYERLSADLLNAPLPPAEKESHAA